jgi:hypothetical protein
MSELGCYWVAEIVRTIGQRRQPEAISRSGLLEFGFGRAGLGGDDSWGYNHSDKGEGNEKVMHEVVSFVVFS